MEREEMLIYIKKKLTPKRYVHSIGVEYTAATMAFVHGEDVQRARIAGLLHDCAKCIPVEEKLKKAEKFGLPVSDCERQNPDLLHGKLGAYYAANKCGVSDEEILSAITFHTTGKPEMTLLEKIIFVADYIEPNRRMIRELPEIRKEAYTDLDRCVLHILRNTLEYLDEKDTVIDDLTQKTYDYYMRHFQAGEDMKHA
ncbi:MAG: bis(5'-nucleosyl)-tetraphosphatase (symmetrical) YqeK [Eubacterium sp.]|nr:bis(5'-nucleosyl)-tetraphosphatase (symmetrical) YqeK [Eubacterium sp.]